MELGLKTQDRDKEIIIAMIENESLGTILENNISKLYFPVGLKENIEVKLQQLETQFAFSWSWKLLLDNTEFVFYSTYLPKDEFFDYLIA